MKIAKRSEFAATPVDVFAIMTDRGFQDTKCERTGALKHTALVSTQGNRTLIHTERTLPADSLPDYAKSLIGETLSAIETQSWGPAAHDGARTATLDLKIGGTPMVLKGMASLTSGGAGTILVVDGDLRAGIPLIAGRIERAAAPFIVAGITIEAETIEDYLAG